MKQQIKTFLAGGLLALALFGTAMAGPLEDGLVAYQKGDYATALSQWRPLADQGNPYAQNAIGMMYELGQGVAQDYAQAIAWYRKAADQGNADAQSNIGKMYDKGQGVPQDHAQALIWLRKAADQGNAAGQTALGWMYANGQGVPQDNAQAIAWYRKAADQGNADAQFNLGSMYDKGQGVPQDYAQAAAWFGKAADQGNSLAQSALGFAYANGRGVPQDYAQALIWLRKAADQGNARAQNNLGLMYANGQGVPQDDAQAIAWFRKAADQGYADAQNAVGVMYAQGRVVPQDDTQAIAWYRKAADQGNAAAQNNLGMMYANGQGVPQDNAQAIAWHRKAADQGNADAQFNLGSMYAQGLGVPQDYAQAAAWFGKAADQGNVGAQGALGWMYDKGQGVPQNYVRAHMWLNLAVSRLDDATRQMADKVRDDMRQGAVKERDDVATKMTPAQVAEAQRMASEWVRAHDAPPISGMNKSAVPMVSDGGTFKVPVTINGQLTLKFVVDSGAADVSIPADVVMTLLRTETITDADFLDKQTYQLADGSTIPSQRFVIRTLKIGDKTLGNVVGSIAPAAGSLLLGQSFLGRFNSWSIDNQRRALILIDNPPEQPTVSSPRPPEISGSSSPYRSPIPAAGEPQGGQSPPQSGQEPANPEAKKRTFLPSAARAAMLIATPDNPQKPVVNLGSTVWSTIPAAPGQPETVALKADADIPDLKMHASMTLRKNTDPSLQATHTIDLKFVFADGAPIAGFKDVGIPQMRKLDSTASEALTSVKVKVSDVHFVIALAKGDQDTSRNLGLMQTRAWFDFPLLLNDDRIAKLVFQKSSEGEAMLANASETWNKYASTPAPAAAPQADLPIPPDPFGAPQADAPIPATIAKPAGDPQGGPGEQAAAPRSGELGVNAPVGTPIPTIADLPQYNFARSVEESPVAGGSAESRYLTIVYGKIKAHLRETPDLHLDLANRHGIVDFYVDKGGNLTGRKLVASSGSPNLDIAVMTAIMEAAPYPAPPHWSPISLNYNFGRAPAGGH